MRSQSLAGKALDLGWPKEKPATRLKTRTIATPHLILLDVSITSSSMRLNLRPRSVQRARSAAGASIASPGPLGRVVRRSTPHGALVLRFLAITHSQLTEQVASHHGSDRPRKVELHPARASLDVGTAPTPCEQVKVEERLVACVEDARPFLDDPGPRPQVGEQVGEVIEQLWRTVRHGSFGPSGRPALRSRTCRRAPLPVL